MIENNTNARVALRLASEQAGADLPLAGVTDLAEGYLTWLNDKMIEPDPTPAPSASSGKSSGGASSKGDGKGEPTEKQVNWAKTLLRDRDHDYGDYDFAGKTYGDVSSLIDDLMTKARS